MTTLCRNQRFRRLVIASVHYKSPIGVHSADNPKHCLGSHDSPLPCARLVPGIRSRRADPRIAAAAEPVIEQHWNFGITDECRCPGKASYRGTSFSSCPQRRRPENIGFKSQAVAPHLRHYAKLQRREPKCPASSAHHAPEIRTCPA